MIPGRPDALVQGPRGAQYRSAHADEQLVCNKIVGVFQQLRNDIRKTVFRDMMQDEGIHGGVHSAPTDLSRDRNPRLFQEMLQQVSCIKDRFGLLMGKDDSSLVQAGFENPGYHHGQQGGLGFGGNEFRSRAPEVHRIEIDTQGPVGGVERLKGIGDTGDRQGVCEIGVVQHDAIKGMDPAGQGLGDHGKGFGDEKRISESFDFQPVLIIQVKISGKSMIGA